MEANQIRKIYEAMARNGFSNLELEIGTESRIRLQLEEDCHNAQPAVAPGEATDNAADIRNTQMEIRSDKVGSFFFAERQLKPGDAIRKGEIIGIIKGISFQDKVKCSLDGILHRVEVENGSIVDYGRLLFIVNID
jgi:biotin carboxyl carrier protein